MTPGLSRELLNTFPGKSILILGDIILDAYIWGEVKRISPEAPVPVVDIHSRSSLPGGAGNVAANILGLCGRVRLGGVIGSDQSGKDLCDALQDLRVPTGGILIDPDRPTTTKTRVIAHNQHVVRLDSELRVPLSTAVENALLVWADQNVKGADVCVLSDYAKGVVSPRLAAHLIRITRDAGRPVLVDPKGADYTMYRGATVIKPNLHEAERFLNRPIQDEQSLIEAGLRLAAALEGTAILITRGPHGMSLFLEGEKPVHIPTVARNVFDVTGAGDTVISTLAMALAARLSVQQSVRLANVAAGIAVGKVGTAVVSLNDLVDGLGERLSGCPS